ncbi:unnamed protein product [Microthlaspi erraticum]|uniref:Uncharacterized protein n=1 Tax=Microthlaspi erraticum TaxID=1685480 RepID=A0A6D2ILI8_9BRAS|nr:unnamed protein product [Microthlaspi erraticum]
METRDRLAWLSHGSGEYTVKTGYFVARNRANGKRNEVEPDSTFNWITERNNASPSIPLSFCSIGLEVGAIQRTSGISRLHLYKSRNCRNQNATTPSAYRNSSWIFDPLDPMEYLAEQK